MRNLIRSPYCGKNSQTGKIHFVIICAKRKQIKVIAKNRGAIYQYFNIVFLWAVFLLPNIKDKTQIEKREKVTTEINIKVKVDSEIIKLDEKTETLS